MRAGVEGTWAVRLARAASLETRWAGRTRRRARTAMQLTMVAVAAVRIETLLSPMRSMRLGHALSASAPNSGPDASCCSSCIAPTHIFGLLSPITGTSEPTMCETVSASSSTEASACSSCASPSIRCFVSREPSSPSGASSALAMATGFHQRVFLGF